MVIRATARAKEASSGAPLRCAGSIFDAEDRIDGPAGTRPDFYQPIERLNGTTGLHMRHFTRLTYAFSKKIENFGAAVALAA
jgi:hypothetical protein